MNFIIVIAILTCLNDNKIIALPLESLQELSDNEVETTDNDQIDLTDLESIMYGLPSEETGKKVAEWHEDDGINPEELGEYAQGDILFPALETRSGLKSEYSRWPGGEIPYMISPSFSNTEHALIMKAIDKFNKYTCVKFYPRTAESVYIRITSGYSGCWSPVGYSGSRIDVNLQRPGCVTKIGTIEHELMHVLGFIHEQGRSDRDEKVAIQWQNIKFGSEKNFEKYSRATIDDFGIPYDYGSVMHYSDRAFSANGKPTIIPKGNKKTLMGQREDFSPSDIAKINRMYKCSGKREVREDKQLNHSEVSTTERSDCWFGMLC